MVERAAARDLASAGVESFIASSSKSAAWIVVVMPTFTLPGFVTVAPAISIHAGTATRAQQRFRPAF